MTQLFYVQFRCFLDLNSRFSRKIFGDFMTTFQLDIFRWTDEKSYFEYIYLAEFNDIFRKYFLIDVSKHMPSFWLMLYVISFWFIHAHILTTFSVEFVADIV